MTMIHKTRRRRPFLCEIWPFKLCLCLCILILILFDSAWGGTAYSADTHYLHFALTPMPIQYTETVTFCMCYVQCMYTYVCYFMVRWCRFAIVWLLPNECIQWIAWSAHCLPVSRMQQHCYQAR